MSKLNENERTMAVRIAKYNLRSDKRECRPPECDEERALLAMKSPDFGYLKEGVVLLRYHGYDKCRQIYR